MTASLYLTSRVVSTSLGAMSHGISSNSSVIEEAVFSLKGAHHRPCISLYDADNWLVMQVVLAPVLLGAVLNQTFPREMKKVGTVAPLIAVLMTVRHSTLVPKRLCYSYLEAI